MQMELGLRPLCWPWTRQLDSASTHELGLASPHNLGNHSLRDQSNSLGKVYNKVNREQQ